MPQRKGNVKEEPTEDEAQHTGPLLQNLDEELKIGDKFWVAVQDSGRYEAGMIFKDEHFLLKSLGIRLQSVGIRFCQALYIPILFFQIYGQTNAAIAESLEI